jgi:hypothetical protein
LSDTSVDLADTATLIDRGENTTRKRTPITKGKGKAQRRGYLKKKGRKKIRK